MSKEHKQLTLGILFLAMLFGPILYLRLTGFDRMGVAKPVLAEQSELLKRYGFWLEEASADAKLIFQHTPPKIDSKLAHIEPQIASMGASVSVVDFDGDGWADIYVTNSAPGSKNSLFRNQQNGTFRDVAEEIGVADVNQPGTGACMGSVWADYDNDGDPDLFVYKWGSPELFRNESGESFTNVTDSVGLPEWTNAGSATWFDYDRDGWIDLLIAGYWPESTRLETLANTKIMPESFEYANNGGRKWLLRNTGDGKFEDVTHAMGIGSTRWTLAVVAADFNGDAEPDLFFANDYGISELYLNEVRDGVRKFREVSKECGIGKAPKSGMNAAVGDVLNRGSLSIYESNISEEGVLIQGNNLWFPMETENLQFQNMASVMGVELGGWSFGAQFADLNNDGFLDLYVTNGYVSGDPGTTYWYDFSEITGGHTQIISDAKNWPSMEGRSLAGYQQKRIWINNGSGNFVEVAQSVGAKDTYDGRAVALADFQNRGALDVVVANQRGPLVLYRNHPAAERHWIEFELEGTTSNRDAYGAQIRLHWNGQEQLQELVSASGYSAQNQRRLHFGLGSQKVVDKVVIRWPSGREQTIESPQVDTLHQIREEL